MVPISEYAIGAWGTGRVPHKTDQIQECAMRFFGGYPRFTPIIGMTWEFGWVPGVVRRDVESVHFFNQLLWIPEDRLTKVAYRTDRTCMGRWSENVVNILTCADVIHCWECETPVNLKVLRAKLMSLYDGLLKNEIGQMSKLSVLSEVKPEAEVSPHLTANLPKYE